MVSFDSICFVNKDFLFSFKVPKNAESLKNIGDYCVKTRTKEANCAKMLDLLKQKFQGCQQISKDNDNECINFKNMFCTAFKDFPCCADVRFFI